MVTPWKDTIGKFFPDYVAPPPKPVEHVESWDDKPFIFTVGGKEMEFFSIGQLGRALGDRSPNTLRAWEREGMIPKSPYVKPSADPRGRRRMYTRAMVEGMVKIAKEEGVLWPHKGRKLSETQFQQRVLLLFQTLRKSPQ